MSHVLPAAAPAGKESSVLVLAPDQERLFEAFLAGRNAQTRRAYRADLASFAAFWGRHAPAFALVDPGAASLALLAAGHGAANALALAWRADMIAAELAPATINRRLAALKSLVKLGGTLGIVAWRLEVDPVKAAKYRDTAGPGKDGYQAMLAQARKRTDAKGRRDVAIIRLLFDVALRRGEVVGLDLEHVDAKRPAVMVLGKGRTERERVSLPKPTMADLTAWISLRGERAGPLFVSLDPGSDGARLTGEAVRRLVAALSAAAGLGKVRPHGLRHAAITAVLDATGGDLRKAARFSRHKQVQTLTIYDDNRLDLGGECAALIAEE